MTRFTVVWLHEARNELADCWLAASDRSAITGAANLVDRQLAVDPSNRGVYVSENLWRIDIEPLRVYFSIAQDDRLVEVTNIVVLPPRDHS